MASSGPSLDVCDILQERIKEYSFVDNDQKLKKYRCCACGNVAISHCIANCGDVFCTKCYLNYFRKSCPNCEAKLTYNKEDDEFESAVLELKVKCKYTKNGCEEIISLIDFLKHIKLCKFTTNKQLSNSYQGNPVAESIQQTNDKNKNKTVINEDSKKEGESVKGQIKHEMKTLHAVNLQMVLANKDEIRELTKNKAEISTKNKFKDIEALYSTSLQNFTEEWNNNKTAILTEIQDLKNEIQDSRNQNDSFRVTFEGTINSLVKKINENIIQNKEVTDGMQTEFMQKMERSAKTWHDQNKEELEKLESRLRKRLDELERKLICTSERNIQESHQQLHPDDDEDQLKYIFMWKISGFKKKLQRLMGKERIKIEREECFTTQHGLRFTPVLEGFGPSIYIELDFSNNPLSSLPFLHWRKYILLDQRSAIQKVNFELIDRAEFKKNSVKDTMQPSLSKYCFFPRLLLEGENNYVKDDEILIEIILEPISLLWKQIESFDGIFLWRIQDYSKKKKDEIDGLNHCLNSEPFKSSQVMGYTAYLQLYLNTDGQEEGNYISIFLCFVLGEHDDSLPLPFKCNYTFSLLDQSDFPMKENISCEFNKEFKEDELDGGICEFVLHSTVESTKYLKNDSILIRTTLKML